MAVSCIVIQGYDITREIVGELAKQMKAGEHCGNIVRDGHNYTWVSYDYGMISEAP